MNQEIPVVGVGVQGEAWDSPNEVESVLKRLRDLDSLLREILAPDLELPELRRIMIENHAGQPSIVPLFSASQTGARAEYMG